MDWKKLHLDLNENGLKKEFDEVVKKALVNWLCDEIEETSKLLKATWQTAPEDGRKEVANQLFDFAALLSDLGEGAYDD
ncbi:MAG: hypothetical protein GT601_05895 [Acidaminobacter sp.]|uniref:hypothetical protein n=1 Tax=Acidaminobacter sp. TaxID=1872102 RepID=UPI00138467F3|nr:hypothetical protein [Acidaminobacter sp.]MZQ97188.1 hypothetical protein [Acidaminobacter sp.]